VTIDFEIGEIKGSIMWVKPESVYNPIIIYVKRSRMECLFAREIFGFTRVSIEIMG